MPHDPLSPAEALRTRLGIAFVALTIVVFAYALVIVTQIIAGLWFVVFAAGLYLFYRLLAVLDSIADAPQRMAAVREAEIHSDGETNTQ